MSRTGIDAADVGTKGVATAAVAQVAGQRDVARLPGLSGVVAASVSGPAWPCRCLAGDNLALHAAVRTAPRGAVIVCDAGGDTDHGYFGELLAAAAQAKGVAGLVIDATIRDAGELTGMRFPVYALGTNPFPTRKEGMVSVGEPIRIRGVRIAPGDIVVADDDAVLVVRGRAWAEIHSRALELQERETRIKERMNRGEELWSILGLEDPRSSAAR